MVFNYPTWHHGYNTQHGILPPHVTPCLQRSQITWTSNIVFIYLKKSLMMNFYFDINQIQTIFI